MFRLPKARDWFRAILFPVLAVFFSPVLFAGGPLSDLDGDWMDDATDPAPLLANLPFHWAVHSVSFQYFWDAGQTNGFRLVLSEEHSAPQLTTPSVLTAVPAFQENHVISGQSARLGLFGDGAVVWGAGGRCRAALAAESLANVADDAPVDFGFVIHFTNLGPVHWRLSNISVPVELGGKARMTASPVQEQAREHGFLLPGDGKSYVVPFSATVAAREARDLLKEIAGGDSSLDFAFARADGVEVVADDGKVFPWKEVSRSILDKTAPVRVEGPAGSTWLWRIARVGADRKATTIGDWAGALRGGGFEGGEGSLPPVVFADDGVLLSLAGWDTGTWDDWWQPSVRGRDLRGLDWRSRECAKGVVFSLRHCPPSLLPADREKLSSSHAVPPVYPALLGITLWNEGDREECYRYFRQAAALGSAQAFSWLGFATASNENLPSNHFYSAASYKRAADLGYAPGEAWYGNCLLRGIGVQADPKAALVYLKRAADQKFPEAQALYGLCLLRGVGGQVDVDKALGILREAASRGDTTAQFGLGTYLLQKGEPEGLELVWIAAHGGHDRAQMRLADLIRKGEQGMPPDPVRAAKWLEVAAGQGNARAMIALGEALQSGNGVRRDPRKAARYFQRAAQAGNRQGETWYAICLLDGVGVRQNPAEAVVWLEKAARRGFPVAQYILGLCLHGGFGGIPMDKPAAIRWFEVAAPSQSQAGVFLGYCYFTGDGVEQDKGRAVKLFERAAKSGSVPAQLWLAYCFAHGEGVTMDCAQARKWAQAAADQGSAAGKAMLSNLPLP